MTNFLPKAETWTIDVVQHFITHLIDDVRQQLSATGYHYDPTTASRQPYEQITNLQRAYAAASSAEQQINRVKRIAKHEISAQSFVANVNTSVADRTIDKYKKKECWGCGEEHTYANRQGQILCPNKDKNLESSNKQQRRAKTTTIESKIVKATKSAQSITTLQTP
jgi:hypothetical protein